jgi:hypothetical protein
MPIILTYILRGLLLGAVGYAGLKILEYALEQMDEKVTKPIVDEEKRKRGLAGCVLWAEKPSPLGIVFTAAELRHMASLSPLLTYDEEEQVLRIIGNIKKDEDKRPN